MYLSATDLCHLLHLQNLEKPTYWRALASVNWSFKAIESAHFYYLNMHLTLLTKVLHSPFFSFSVYSTSQSPTPVQTRCSPSPLETGMSHRSWPTMRTASWCEHPQTNSNRPTKLTPPHSQQQITLDHNFTVVSCGYTLFANKHKSHRCNTCLLNIYEVL